MRSHYCGEVGTSLVDTEVDVTGWVHRRRDHGGVIFVDLRDRTGLLQIVFDPDQAEIFAEAERIRSEFVLLVKGKARLRPEGTVNKDMKTGQVEVLAIDLVTLNASPTPPFHHDENANEELRLKYRYLDLRREEMQKNLHLRHKVTQSIRKFLDKNGFLDIEMSFVDESSVMIMMEKLIRNLFSNVLNVKLPSRFKTMAYKDAMFKYGSDKPDLRIPLELIEVSDLMKNVEFKVFSKPANDSESRVAALCVPGGSSLTRKEIDTYTEYVSRYNARGLAYIKVNDIKSGREGLRSPIIKFFTDDTVSEVLKRVSAKNVDIIFFGADK